MFATIQTVHAQHVAYINVFPLSIPYDKPKAQTLPTACNVSHATAAVLCCFSYLWAELSPFNWVCRPRCVVAFCCWRNRISIMYTSNTQWNYVPSLFMRQRLFWKKNLSTIVRYPHIPLYYPEILFWRHCVDLKAVNLVNRAVHVG